MIARKMLDGVLLLLVAVLSAGCTTSHVVLGTTREPITPSEVRVFISPPDVRYEQVAVISSDSGWSFTPGAQAKMNKVLKRIKSDAAKLGANGIILSGFGDYVSALVANDTGTFGVPMYEKKGSALAIYIPPEQSDYSILVPTVSFGASAQELVSAYGIGEEVELESLGMAALADAGPARAMKYDMRDGVQCFCVVNGRVAGVIGVKKSGFLDYDIPMILRALSGGAKWTLQRANEANLPDKWECDNGKFSALAYPEQGALLAGDNSILVFQDLPGRLAED